MLSFTYYYLKISNNKPLAIFICAAASLVVSSLCVLDWVPVPSAHDEFSYLLAADTFLENRLTNPTHPMWQHFESFHIIHQPSYASKYPPGQGALFALGIVLTGLPIFGAVISTAFAAAATCWMLQGLIPPRWAFVGGLLVAFHNEILISWSLSYWGGALSMAGGALLFGAMSRIRFRSKKNDAIILALGAVILLMTRPFEGFVTGVCVSCALLMWMVGPKSPGFKNIFSQIVVPAFIVLSMGIALFCLYNFKVTGNPLTLPYQVHEETYSYYPTFSFLPINEDVEHRHEILHDYQKGWNLEPYVRNKKLLGWVEAQVEHIQMLVDFYFSPALFMSLATLPMFFLSRKLRFAWITILVFYFFRSTVPIAFPHYFSPVAPLFFLIVTQGFRSLHVSLKKNKFFRFSLIPYLCGIYLISMAATVWEYGIDQHLVDIPRGWKYRRAEIVSQLSRSENKHLVIVKYKSRHNVHQEWVYNKADIDNSKIVWARDMGAPKNEELLQYFKDRKAWFIEVDILPRRLLPL